MSGFRSDPLNRAASGKIAENAARAYLRGLRREVIESNYRTRFGEIDIIARDGETICFVEVRARRGGAMVSPAESVGSAKQARLSKAASEWLAGAGADAPCRFDVIEVELTGRTARIIGIIEAAFQPAGEE